MLYQVQVKADNQLNHHTVSAQIIDETGNVLYNHLSNAEVNKG